MEVKTALSGESRDNPKLAVGVVVAMYLYFAASLIAISHVFTRGLYLT